jgi:hypothetical protein
MRAAAIVVTHDSADHVGHCLEPLVSAGAEVVVVDNASSDGTAALVRSRFPGVRLLTNADNRGFAAAVNQGLATVQADVVVLVNPDCVVPPATLRTLVGFLGEHEGVGVVGPRLLGPGGTTAVSAHPFEDLGTVVASRFGGSLVPVRVRRMLVRAKRRRSYDACRGGEAQVAVDWVSGACLAVRTDLLRRLGGLDPGYFMYYEDEELCLQSWRAGRAVVYLPSVQATHVGGASTRDPAHAWPHLYRSMLRFHARHRPGTYTLVRAAILIRAGLGIAVGSVRDTLALVRRRPPRRVLAWGRIALVAVRADRPVAAEARP